MACSKQIGIIDIPIVCVNIDGYYDSFSSILQRAHEDQFLYKRPEDILHFEPNSEKAVEWIEKFIVHKKVRKKVTVIDNARISAIQKKTISRKPSALKRMMSVFNLPSDIDFSAEESATRNFAYSSISLTYFALFSAGLALGLMKSSHNSYRNY